LEATANSIWFVFGFFFFLFCLVASPSHMAAAAISAPELCVAAGRCGQQLCVRRQSRAVWWGAGWV